MPDDDKLRERAYAIWEQEGRPEGRDQDHWYRADQELNGKPLENLDLDSGVIAPNGQPAAAPASEMTEASNTGVP